MRSIRIFAGVIAATALLTLSEAQTAAQPAESAGAASPKAPDLSPRSAAIVTRATALDVVVGAAAAGNVEAMNLLGVLYTLGTQVPQDYSLAMYWFQKAIDGGSADAMSNLATMYLFGIGVSRDRVNARRWFERAAAHGNVHSMFSVAVMAEKGLGAACDVRLARAMYLRAAESGFAPAMIWLSNDYAHGSSTKRDLVEAYSWLQVAMQSDLPEELQISTLSSMEAIEARLGPKRRDEARVRAANLIALVKTRALPADSKAPAPMRLSMN
jgi:TPR repeat protein